MEVFRRYHYLQQAYFSEQLSPVLVGRVAAEMRAKGRGCQPDPSKSGPQGRIVKPAALLLDDDGMVRAVANKPSE